MSSKACAVPLCVGIVFVLDKHFFLDPDTSFIGCLTALAVNTATLAFFHQEIQDRWKSYWDERTHEANRLVGTREEVQQKLSSYDAAIKQQEDAINDIKEAVLKIEAVTKGKQKIIEDLRIKRTEREKNKNELLFQKNKLINEMVAELNKIKKFKDKAEEIERKLHNNNANIDDVIEVIKEEYIETEDKELSETRGQISIKQRDQIAFLEKIQKLKEDLEKSRQSLRQAEEKMLTAASREQQKENELTQKENEQRALNFTQIESEYTALKTKYEEAEQNYLSKDAELNQNKLVGSPDSKQVQELSEKDKLGLKSYEELLGIKYNLNISLAKVNEEIKSLVSDINKLFQAIYKNLSNLNTRTIQLVTEWCEGLQSKKDAITMEKDEALTAFFQPSADEKEKILIYYNGMNKILFNCIEQLRFFLSNSPKVIRLSSDSSLPVALKKWDNELNALERLDLEEKINEIGLACNQKIRNYIALSAEVQKAKLFFEHLDYDPLTINERIIE